ncbi:hypothetical protein [Streptomyces sp. NPDC052015]
MHRGLHGRGALFDSDPPGLAPRLIGLSADAREGVASFVERREARFRGR